MWRENPTHSIRKYHSVMRASSKSLILAIAVVGVVFSVLILTSTGLEAATPRTSSTSTCVADMDRAPADIPIPIPTRLKVTKQLFGFSFTPVDAQFVPRASARDAWRKFDESKQST